MCGRYTLSSPEDVLRHLLEIEEPLDPEEALEPRYNVAPGQDCPVVGVDPEGRRKLRKLRWGLVPGWSKDPKSGSRPINARSETVAEKPTFRVPFLRRRILVPADGFYEWKREGKGKQPYLVRRRDRQPFVMAGIWDRWGPGPGSRKGPETLDTFAVLTTEAAPELRELHHRMPVILPLDRIATWLDPQLRDPQRLAALLQPLDGSLLDLTPVDPRVGRVSEDDPGLLQPWGA